MLMTKNEYKEIQNMLSNAQKQNADKHGCKTGKRKEGWDEAFEVMKSLLHNYMHKQQLEKGESKCD